MHSENSHIIFTVLHKLGNLQQFFIWNYSHQHLKISGAYVSHCKTYVIGGTCDHEHVGACKTCTRLANFFDMSFASFINNIVLKELNDDQLQP